VGGCEVAATHFFFWGDCFSILVFFNPVDQSKTASWVDYLYYRTHKGIEADLILGKVDLNLRSASKNELLLRD